MRFPGLRWPPHRRRGFMFDAVAATLPAADMARAKEFYRERLSLEPFQEEPDGSARYRLGESMFLIYPSEFAGTNRATAAGFAVSNIEAVVGDLRGRGVVFEELDYGEAKTVNGILSMPSGTRGAWFKDSEGNTIGLFQDA
jgi:predicted enzyme related to lactoylglutathione lyase